MTLEHCSRGSCVQIIEGLKEKYARLHAASCRDDDTIAALREERDKVIAELAAVQARLDAYSWEAENTALRAQVAALTKDLNFAIDARLADRLDLIRQLAAAQAHITQLREALIVLQSSTATQGDYGRALQKAISDALTIPTDTAVLDARLKEERERCAIECEKYASNTSHQDVAAAIREMK